MHARHGFARLGRPTLYAIVAAMLLPVLLSVTAPQVAASPDSPPTIENITVNSALIDRDVDYAGSGAVTSTTVTVRVRDNDGYGNISAVYISVRDNNDNMLVENQNIFSTLTAVDENTADFTYAFNPLDNIEDNQLGNFDVRCAAVDNTGLDSDNDIFVTVARYENSDNYFFETSGGGQATLDNVYKSEGSYSGKVHTTSAPSWASIMTNVKFNFENYGRLRFWAKWSSSSSSNPVRVQISPDNASWTTLWEKDYTSAPGEEVVTLDVGGYDNSYYFKIYAGTVSAANPGSTLWVDNVRLFERSWEDNLFVVDDLSATINFDPASPNVGWDLTVSGTHSRVVGSVSIDASWLIDNKHGQFALGASDTYNETYAISNADENENVSVTLRALDSPLDGATTSSYEVNENVKFQVWVRFEENYGVVGWIPDENRVIDLLFEWDGGTHPYTLTSNPENITVPSAGVSINIVKLTDNDDYWRYIIPLYSGGDLNFIIVDDISDVEQYRFFLQDYTAQYIPPNGQMLVKSWIGTDLADINGDYWGADWRTTAWLVTGTQYQIWVRGLNAPLRLVGPIDAVNPAEEKTIAVQVIVENVAPIFDDVYWNAWRIDNSTIRMEYQDNLDNTIEAHVAIFDENGVQQIEYQPDNEWFIVTWLGADGAESYEVVLTVQHGVHGDFVMTMPIGTLEGPPGVEGGVSSPWDLPAGMTIAGIGSIILVTIVGLAFDALRVQIGMLAMALTLIFTWQMGFLPLPGPYGGSFTATLILVMAVLFALTWRRGK